MRVKRVQNMRPYMRPSGQVSGWTGECRDPRWRAGRRLPRPRTTRPRGAAAVRRSAPCAPGGRGPPWAGARGAVPPVSRAARRPRGGPWRRAGRVRLHDPRLHDPRLQDPGMQDPRLHRPGLHGPGRRRPGRRRPSRGGHRGAAARRGDRADRVRGTRPRRRAGRPAWGARVRRRVVRSHARARRKPPARRSTHSRCRRGGRRGRGAGPGATASDHHAARAGGQVSAPGPAKPSTEGRSGCRGMDAQGVRAGRGRAGAASAGAGETVPRAHCDRFCRAGRFTGPGGRARGRGWTWRENPDKVRMGTTVRTLGEARPPVLRGAVPAPRISPARPAGTPR